MTEPIRKLAAIVFTDIVGFTKLTAKDQSKASALLKQQRELFRPIVDSYKGQWVKEMGDGLLLTFDTVTDAVNCCIKLQETSKQIDDLDLRIGIHEGEILIEENDIIGDDVNIAARIEPFSAPGGIAISNKVHDAIVRESDFTTKYLGKPKLKGVGQEVKVFCITSHGLPETKVSKVSAKLEPEGLQWNVFSITGAVLTVIGVLFWINVSFLGIGIAEEVPSIGILLMENLGKEEDQFWARGITEDLIIKVAGAGLVRVAPMKEIKKVNMDDEFENIARQLHVKHLLISSIYRHANGFDLRCQMIDAKSGNSKYAHKWSEPLNKSPTIVGSLADNILNTLQVDSKQEMIAAESINPEAYEFYLKGKYRYNNRKNMEDMEIARGFLIKANELDENYLSSIILLAGTYNSTSEHDKAIDLLTGALKKAEQLGDKDFTARILYTLGAASNGKGEDDQAKTYYEKALSIAIERDNKKLIGSININIGNMHSFKNDLDKGLEYYTSALRIYEELDNKKGIAVAYSNIGIIHIKQKDRNSGLEYFKKALDAYEKLEDQEGIGRVLGNMGNIYIKIGDLAEAIMTLEKSFDIQMSIGAIRGAAFPLKAIAGLEELQGNYQVTISHYKEYFEIQTEIGHQRRTSYGNYFLGSTYYKVGESQRALPYLKKAIEIQMDLELNDVLVESEIFHSLCLKDLNKEIDIDRIIQLTEDAELSYDTFYYLYRLSKNGQFLDSANVKLQETLSEMEPQFRDGYMSYPTPKAIIQEWEKVS